MKSQNQYFSRANAAILSLICLPFTLLFILAGVAIYWAAGLKSPALIFIALGLFGTWACFNSSWSKITFTHKAIVKRNLLSFASVSWNDVRSWTWIPQGLDDLERVEFTSTNGGRMTVYAFEVEVPGITVFVDMLRKRIGKLELTTDANVAG